MKFDMDEFARWFSFAPFLVSWLVVIAAIVQGATLGVVIGFLILALVCTLALLKVWSKGD